MTSKAIAVAVLAFVGCGSKKEVPDVAPTPAQVASYDEVADRLAGFAPDGFVISRGDDGDHDQGDSLLFTGLAVYGLDCARGAPLANALAKMVSDTGGALYRHPSLPDQVSLDGAVGFYRGVLKRVQDCGEASTWGPLLAQHVAYMKANGGRLNAGASATLPAGFEYLRDKVASVAGAGSNPSASRRALIESAAASWAGADIAAHKSCYRVHLALNALQQVEEAGDKIAPAARHLFCQWTGGADLPTTNHWCGSGDLAGWLDGFQYDVWSYRHQRCADWEQPDGNGRSQPAVDYLVGWADLHGSPH